MIVVALALIVGIYFTWFSDATKGPNKYKWYKTFEDGNIEPYDFGLLKKLLKHESPQGFTEVTSDLTKKLSRLEANDSNTYLFIGEYCYYSQK